MAEMVASSTQQIDESELKRLIEDEAMKLPDMNIAISGLAGRFPKSDSVNEFEENLREGVDMVNENDEARFTCGLWGLPPRAGRLKDLSRFDSEFFGFSPEEANYVDFQMRILYEVVYESILDAGLNPAELRGTNTGVYFGLHCNEFENAMADDPAFKTNGYYAQYAVKIAQYFDFRGITLTFDAACASGFVGLHSAVQALNDGLIDQAIVCSSNIPIHPTGSFIFLQMQMLSPTGYSRFLDSRADGYVKSEACVSVLLQKKHLAQRNYASVMATMTSVDGYKSEGITFPSHNTQEQLIRATKELAGISTNHIQYIEAHGTGTPAGDPQEARAISSVYYPKVDVGQEEPKEVTGRAQHSPKEEEEARKIGPLLVGSVKTNMGHSEAASGLCALAKVILMLENEMIYKSLHYAQPNSNIDSLMDGRIRFTEENQKFGAKIVPLSCYGFGGSNVHAIVRASELPTVDGAIDTLSLISKQNPRLIVMFGRSNGAIDHFFNQMLNSSDLNTRNCLSEDFLALIDSLSKNKIDRLMNHRGFMVIDNNNQSKKELTRSVGHCELPASSSHNSEDFGRPQHIQDCSPRRFNIILPGIGSQWIGMATGLRQYEPFWSTIERLAELLEPFKDDVDLVRCLTVTDNEELLDSMAAKFVTIVAYEIALINMVKDKLKVNQMSHIVGHSLGEIACAYAAGIFDERETIMVAYQMGKTLDENRHSIEGKMVALDVSQAEAEQLIASHGCGTVRVCCVNGPQSVTISGSSNDMERFCQKLAKESIYYHQVENYFALHNETIMTSDIKILLSQALTRVLFPLTDYSRKNSHWISSFTLDEERLARQANVEYFAESLCKKVDFLKAIQQLPEDSIALELGPSGIFESQLKQLDSQKDGSAKFHYVKLMRRNVQEDEQVVQLLVGIGNLYRAGATFDLQHFYDGPLKRGNRVRRRTPSISSIFRWNHEYKLFVPRYPQQFSKSSAKSEMPVDIVQERDKYLMGHCIEGRILFPATAYLFLIWRVFSFTKRKIYDASFQDVESSLVPIEFRNVRLLRATILGNRCAQVYTHYEEATGRFEVKEGGSVVVDGYASLPVESPDDLLYDNVRSRIQEENLELTLNKDDIYKQFRVSGYDYGESFRNIEASSYDGRYCRVRFNGHFIALTDSILQSIFLAITQYAPSGGLFLPTRFDYVRFQPEIILKKLRAAGMGLDLADGSLNTKAKREIMTKIMQRESGIVDKNAPENNEDTEKTNAEPEKPKVDCIFETYCDPITNIIITDGIEMRGVRATPAPRRSDLNDVLLESYQFVEDHEEPVEDECLTNYNGLQRPYARVCDSLSLDLLTKLCNQRVNLNSLVDPKTIADHEEVCQYKDEHLKSRADKEVKISAKEDTVEDEEEAYDIKRNGDRTLLSVLDLLHTRAKLTPKAIKELVQEHRLHLMHDLLQTSFVSERFVRPLIETVIENSCMKKLKLRLIEINSDDGLMKDALLNLLLSVEPQMTVDYNLAHPDLDRLNENKALLNNPGNQTIKTHTLKDLSSLFSGKQSGGFDLIVYKDISCYSLPKQVVERNGLASVMTTLNLGVRKGGYIMMAMRSKLTLAESLLLSLSEPELVGLNEQDLESLTRNSNGSLSKGIEKIQRIETILESRCELMLEEAKNNKMLCLSKKSDQNGCTIMLFKCTMGGEIINEASMNAHNEAANRFLSNRLMLRVTHENKDSISQWLEDLKGNFKKPEEEKKREDEKVEPEVEEQVTKKEPVEPKTVWLCAVATKQNPINGLIGMMQALRRELGSTYLRCYYDMHTFRDEDEPIKMSDIEKCDNFKRAFERDELWNCVDSMGNFGSYRHFTINNYLSHENYLCNKSSTTQAKRMKLTHGAYINNAVRGDLSSFAWYEVPMKYLNEEDRRSIVRVAYSALNFRDIMLATGRLPLDALPMSLAMSDCLIGLEFSGIDVDGKRVMGMIPAKGLATHCVCPEGSSLKLEIPDWLDLEEAATIPIVYSTAVMAIVYRGRARRGESILIHAGSGGVGQAAIRISAHLGLKIFTTVGSDEKRKFLLDEFGYCLEEGNILNSRDTSFEHAIMEATRGRGVDLVLNSLADDKLQASVRCLADGGRFLEIGKYDLSVNAQLELMKLDTNKTFHGILLDKLFDTDDVGIHFKQQLRCVLQTLKDGFVEGYVKPIKHTMFKRDQIEEAFRFMATGKHIGKVLVEIDGSLNTKINALDRVPLNCVPRFQLSPHKCYLVTGGLGGFGLELIKYLVTSGARYIAITSRSGLRTGYQRATLRRLESNSSVKFLVVDEKMADTITFEGTEKLCQMAMDLSPAKQLGGIFHLAMVLKDSLLENMSADDFELVCRPKVNTCIHLDKVTRSMANTLDYFVAFSSITSGKGNAGQANYAYANSCIERVCERRRADKLHGLAIQWGAIGDVGVAFENLGGNDIIIGGTIPQRMPSCLATLSKLLCSPFATALSVLPVNRSTGGANEKGDLVAAIMHVLGVKDASKVSDEATLGDLGLDSLMAVEIRQYIEREYDMTLNIQEIRALTIAKIREINDGEKPVKRTTDEKGNKLGENGQQKVEVASYGSKLAANSTTSQSESKHSEQTSNGYTENGNTIQTTNVKRIDSDQQDHCRTNYNKMNGQLNHKTVPREIDID